MNNNVYPPPRRVDSNLTVVDHLRESYKIWHDYLVHIPKVSRYTIGTKVDNLFTNCLEYSLLARYADKDSKTEYISKLVVTFDSLKFFLQILWDLKILDDKKYSHLSQQLAEIGKMIGGWSKYIKNETPPTK